jgi:hypothetical protein
MKRVVLSDSRTNIVHLLVNPPWRLGSIKPNKENGTFDVRMVHENGQVLTVNIGAELLSLTNRLEGW